MRAINLASGSDGNITYIEHQDKKIILDMGLSCTETVSRLEKIGVRPEEITAILVSHEHSDHIKGIDVFSNKYHTPVYAHQQVWRGLDYKLKKVDVKHRKMFDGQFEFEDLLITPVKVPHDVECYGFSFNSGNNKISVLTDLGHLNDRILQSVRGSQLIYLEANYDRQMLMQGTKYPLTLKRRIDGPNGHLSNVDSAEAIEFLARTGTRQIVLSHLSKENNTPNLAYTSICKIIEEKGIVEGENIRIDVATPNIGAFFRLK